MKLIKIISAILLFCSAEQFAQFSIEKFLDEPFNQTFTSVKEIYSDKKFEEKEIMNYKALMYYDWLEPISIKVGYMFIKDGKQNGKVIANGKRNEGDAQKLFDIAKTALIKKFGNNYSDNSMLGITMINWKGIESYSIILIRENENTMLTVISK